MTGTMTAGQTLADPQLFQSWLISDPLLYTQRRIGILQLPRILINIVVLNKVFIVQETTINAVLLDIDGPDAMVCVVSPISHVVGWIAWWCRCGTVPKVVALWIPTSMIGNQEILSEISVDVFGKSWFSLG